MKLIVNLVSIATLILLLTETAWGSFQVRPRLTLVEKYTDNLFLSSSEEETDWVTTTEPGVSLVYGSRALDLNIDYSLRFRHHRVHSEEDETELRDIQRSTATSVLFPERNFRIFLDGEISRVSVDERGSDAEESELVNTTNLYRYAINPQYVWKPASNFSATLDYRYEKSDYKSRYGDDTERQKYGLLLERKVSASTALFFNYSFLDHRAMLNRNFKQQTLTAGFNHRVTPRLTLVMNAGPVRTDYSDGSETKGESWGGSVAYNFSAPLMLQLSYLENYTVSVSRGLNSQERTSVSLTYTGGATIEGSAYWSNNEYFDEMAEDRRIGGSVSVNIQHNESYHTYIFYNAEYQRFLPENEEATRQSTGATVGYRSGKLDISFGYVLQGKDSTIDTNDYWNNVLTFSGSMRF